MSRGQKIAAWSTPLITGVILVGLGVYFARIGLDRANKVVTVLGGLGGLAGLGIAVLGVILARSSSSPATAQPTVGDGSQIVQGFSIGGDNIQIGKGRDINIRRG
ncbi:MAG TPA: hypothetical protein VLJ59_16880 [Mycobacteriales bacterium]|nr:hypothetical protein [Mycobacteriales bacterium]